MQKKIVSLILLLSFYSYAIAKDDYLTDHPLFSQQRIPYTSNSSPTIKNQAQPILSGIVIKPHDAYAILKTSLNGKEKPLKTSQSIDGWVVKEIQKRYIIIKKKSYTLKLVVRFDK